MRTEELAYWINNRYLLKQRKDAGEPHHDDPIMAINRWTNVHREDDAVTKWIRENWRNPNASHPNLTLAMVLARMVNWPDSLEEIGFPYEWDPERVAGILRGRARKGQKVWTSAYTISTCGRKMEKAQYVVFHVCDAVAQRDWAVYYEGSTPKTLQRFHTDLMVVDGLGSFLAAQVVADLKNTPGHPLENAPDWYTWAAPGPGSLRGLEALLMRAVPPSLFLGLAQAAKNEVMPLLNPEIPPIHMQDFQNCLCEFSKYIKLKEGRGHARNKYRPR